jgi:hypothetical protein
MKRNDKQAKQKRQARVLIRLEKKITHVTDGNHCCCDMCNREHYNDSRKHEIYALSRKLQGDVK